MSGRVLVVEDDVEVADYVAKGLREAGFNVEHVGDGRDGLYLASSSSFDAIVMDRMVPGMDGLSVVKALRAASVETPILRGLELLPREFKLLEYFLRNKDRVVTRTMLLEQVWDYRFDPHTSIIDTHISRLRKKLDEGYDRPLLHTLRGVGYRLSETP